MPSPLVSMPMSNSAPVALDHWCQPLIAKTRQRSVSGMLGSQNDPSCDWTPTARTLEMPGVWSLSKRPHAYTSAVPEWMP